jgi:hypothetical protein
MEAYMCVQSRGTHIFQIIGLQWRCGCQAYALAAFYPSRVLTDVELTSIQRGAGGIE